MHCDMRRYERMVMSGSVTSMKVPCMPVNGTNWRSQRGEAEPLSYWRVFAQRVGQLVEQILVARNTSLRLPMREEDIALVEERQRKELTELRDTKLQLMMEHNEMQQKRAATEAVQGIRQSG